MSRVCVTIFVWAKTCHLFRVGIKMSQFLCGQKNVTHPREQKTIFGVGWNQNFEQVSLGKIKEGYVIVTTNKNKICNNKNRNISLQHHIGDCKLMKRISIKSVQALPVTA